MSYLPTELASAKLHHACRCQEKICKCVNGNVLLADHPPAINIHGWGLVRYTPHEQLPANTITTWRLVFGLSGQRLWADNKACRHMNKYTLPNKVFETPVDMHLLLQLSAKNHLAIE